MPLQGIQVAGISRTETQKCKTSLWSRDRVPGMLENKHFLEHHNRKCYQHQAGFGRGEMSGSARETENFEHWTSGPRRTIREEKSKRHHHHHRRRRRRRRGNLFFLFQGLRPLWHMPFYSLSLVFPGDGIHHSLLCSVTSGSGDRPRKEGCDGGGVHCFLPGLYFSHPKMETSGVAICFESGEASTRTPPSSMSALLTRLSEHSRTRWLYARFCERSQKTITGESANWGKVLQKEARSRNLHLSLCILHFFFFENYWENKQEKGQNAQMVA